jgi:hypothetical protein
MADLPRAIPRPRRCTILLASGRPIPELAKVLASHALIHAADGEHFRNALAAAAEACGLETLRVAEKDVAARVAERLRLSPAQLTRRVAGWRRELGAPWTADQKLAALAAWAALAGPEPSMR